MKKLLLSATAAIALAAAMPASAAFRPDTTTFLNGFADGYLVQTDLPAGLTVAIFGSSSELAPGEASFTLSGPHVPPVLFEGFIRLLESDGSLSDRFGIKQDPGAPGQLFIGFVSDGASAGDNADFTAAFGGLPDLGFVVETGFSQDVTAFFSTSPLFNVQVISDIPEPATIALLGVGLLGLGLIRRRA